jgi:hypothetical protein
MSEWSDRLARATALRDAIEDDPDAVVGSVEELLALARDEEWSVRRAAVEGLGVGLGARPDAGVAALDELVRTALDASVPAYGGWYAGVDAVIDAAPERGRRAAIDAFEAVPADRRGEPGAACVASALERVAVDSPGVLTGSLDAVRRLSRDAQPRARVHFLGIHLAVADCRDRVRPVVPDLLAEFASGTADTRRVAADLCCALAAHPEDGPTVVAALVDWLATHPRRPRERRRHRDPREPIQPRPLTDAPPSGVLGVTRVLARIAEETPAAVGPHCDAIAGSLAAWESTRADQWARTHLTRAVATVARRDPPAVADALEDGRTLVTDESAFVRYWGAQTMRALAPHRPDVVSPPLVAGLLTDDNPNVRNLGATLVAEALRADVLDAESVVTELRPALTDGTGLERRRAVDVVGTVARHDREAVRPVIPALRESLDGASSADDAAAAVGAVATVDPAAVDDAVPTLVDCLFADTTVVRAAAAEALATVGRVAPSILDEHLGVLTSILDRDHPGIDAVGEVFATVGDRSLDGERTVFEVVQDRSTAASATERATATELLGSLAAAAGEAERAVTALVDRLADPDERVREAALAALATHVAGTGAASLVRSCYETGTERWRAIGAALLSRATLLDGTWPTPAFQRWLAGRLHEARGEPGASLVEAAGYVCGATDAEDELVVALTACLGDDTVAEAAMESLRDVERFGATALPSATVAPAVERMVLDPALNTTPSVLGLLPSVVTDLAASQRVADRLLECLATGDGDAGRIAAALAALTTEGVTLPAEPVVDALERHAVDGRPSPRDWTSANLGRVLRGVDGSEELRRRLVPLARDGASERRGGAYAALASVAVEWPAGVRPAADTLRAGVREDDDTVAGPALSALVAVGRADPAVLRPLADRFVARAADAETVVERRRRYEAIALLAADGSDLGVDAARTLRAGLVDDDTAVEEHALAATASLGDPRLRPVVAHLAADIPEWESPPEGCPPAPEAGADAPFSDLFVDENRRVTATDVLAAFDE